ncbi:hypothetical protein VCRA2119O430_310010 [Vibrio crassostreae]|nr:hypothetical protein VCRA2118O429_250042 [Vibrio crassostreae]CAK1943041.1 hypothetical protein VCRA2114O423_260032 [Vibrio crassostreae]CAK1943345.1 hypothetical protein VCRA2113O412_260042 [Vibrio crassostreae]CAK1944566.1 hypothetical protein VCRA2113O411_260032 [Vibrio crassostreae]CAK1950940.1 hypothetical protein VCRA2113O418_260034 [Vibrio crassostreae]
MSIRLTQLKRECMTHGWHVPPSIKAWTLKFLRVREEGGAGYEA